MLNELNRFCGSLPGSMVVVGEAQGARSFLWVGSTGSMVAVRDAQGARSCQWELDGVYGYCGGCSRSSIVSVEARRGLWLLWGRLKELDRFCGSSTGSMLAVGDARGARSFLSKLDGVYGCCGEAQGARSFLRELDGVYGCCRGCSRRSMALWLL